MKQFSEGEWRYAVLLILLLIIAVIASVQTVSNIEKMVHSLDAERGASGLVLRPAEEVGPHAIQVQDVRGDLLGYVNLQLDPEQVTRLNNAITLTIHALTMGFLLLAGAFGLWAVRSTAEIESRRRVGRFVDAMDYLRDGLIVVDKHGRISGSNPAVRDMAGKVIEKHAGLRDMFPALSSEDKKLLLNPTRPHELEKTCRTSDGQRILRFRSQPSEDMDLIQVSDVTDERLRDMRKRQVANLQMIGRIARGVAHDFNNILCAISGHAALLKLADQAGDSDEASLQAIVHESQRGADLAAHLLELSRTGKSDQPTERLKDHVEKAVELIGVGISNNWTLNTEFDSTLPVVPLSPMQIEQAVLNLGVLSADQAAQPGRLNIRVQRIHPEDTVHLAYGLVIDIHVSREQEKEASLPPSPVTRAAMQTTMEEAGVIQSVVRTMVEEVGGKLNIVRTAAGRRYSIYLPEYVTHDRAVASPPRQQDVTVLMADWNVLTAMPQEPMAGNLREKLEEHGARVERAKDIVGTLSRLDRESMFQGIILDKNLLGAEADGLLRAILKLQPKSGIVVICETMDSIPKELKKDIVFELDSVDPDVLMESLLRSRAQRRG